MRIFLAPLPKNANYIYTCPRTRHMIRQGLAKIPEVEIVELESSADFVIFDYVPHDGKNKYVKDELRNYHPNKLVVIDNSDEHNIFYTDEYFLYFKRSLWETEGFHRKLSPSAKREKVQWFDYGILDEFLYPFVEKKVNFGCYLRPSCSWRATLINWINQSNLPEKYVGEASKASRSQGFEADFDEEYLKALASTSVVFTCQPTGWVSDTRLYEALANRCFVFTDKIYIQHDYPFIHNQHLIEYDLSASGMYQLKHHIQFILDYPSLVGQMANEGYNHAIQHHSSLARMKYVIGKIKDYS